MFVFAVEFEPWISPLLLCIIADACIACVFVCVHRPSLTVSVLLVVLTRGLPAFPDQCNPINSH